MNAYMFYSNNVKAFVVCESRESGLLKTIEVKRNDNICLQIGDKCKAIMSELKKL